MPGKELLTAAEAATKLKITQRTILKWAREGRIECVRISRKVVLFAEDAIDTFVKCKTIGIESEPMNHQRAGRIMASPNPTKKGGDKRNSGELWKDLRKEVIQWQ